MSVSATYANPSAPRVAAILSGKPLPAPQPQITVGEYYRQQSDAAIQSGLNAIGTGLRFTAEAIPGVLLIEMGAIKAAHRQAAYQRIYHLPWDPQGKWKIKADQILAQESAKADAEIRNLPMVRAMVATGQAVVTGATAVGTAIVDGATWVGNATVAGATAVGTAVVDGVTAVGEGAYNAGVYIADGTAKTYKAAGRGFLAWIANLGQSLFNWASRNKPAFQ
ncbi:MAG: hypothetical protein FJZ01_14515 [Candidatus Sericytochromatia bacterium]|nr:hypothetical protein [Candidatus Tanganyikabacteria bacterium]